jgi:3-phenylpropionate/trans-cinnamate dioxygenase ferredoxin reductase subunit
MSHPISKVVVVGGGQAAATSIVSLRQWGFTGDITLVGDETGLPYQRPPLSKGYLKGELSRERLNLKNAKWYEEKSVSLKLGERANAIDTDNHRVLLDAQSIEYDALILATGSRPRLLDLPGADKANVMYLRNVADVDRMRPHMTAGHRMVVIGAGYIGLEVAAVAHQLGMSVTVLEYAERVLARVTSPTMSAFFEKAHREQGVEIITGARMTGFSVNNETVSAIELEDGSSVPTDLVLIGIGIVPNQELASDAGLDCNDGILVDRDARTSHDGIYAVGDVTRRPLVHYDREGRLESVHNAIEQGQLAAASLLGRARPAEDCPWFWSDQFDLKLQIAGLSEGFDDCVIRGSEADRRFAVYYFSGARVLAVDAVNAPLDFVLSKRLIINRAEIDKQQLADPDVSLKELVSAYV